MTHELTAATQVAMPKHTDIIDAFTGPLLVCTGTYFRGGVSSWAIRFARLARRAGLDVRLTMPWPETRDWMDRSSYTLLDHAADLGEAGAVARLPLSRWSQLSTRNDRQNALADALAPLAEGATLLLNNDWDLFGATARLVRRGLAIRVVNIVHSDDEVYYAIARHYAPMFLGVVAVSTVVSEELRSRRLVGPDSEIPDAPVCAIPCGVEMPEAAERTPRDGPIRMVTACRLDERQKRASDIPRVGAVLRERGIDFAWTVLGDGPERARLECSLREAGLSDRIRLLGWCAHDRVLDAFRSADIYVQTSAFEGTPVSVMEAMAYGVVPVVTEVSGTSELLGAGSAKVGLSAPVGDVAALAGAVSSLASDPARLAELSIGAEVRARSVLSIEQTTRALLDFLATLPNGTSRWPSTRSTAVQLADVGEREARLDWLPNPVAVAARWSLRTLRR